MTITIIQPSGETEILDRPGEPSLEELQEWVGGYIEVPGGQGFRAADGSTVQFVLNEDGRLMGLGQNPKASERYFEASGIWWDKLVGPVVILTEPNLLT